MVSARDPQLEPPFSFPPLRDLSPEVSVKTAEVVMRALDKDVEKRPSAAREMMHLLPDPGPEPKTSLGALGSRAGDAAPIASMRTVVLDRPQSAVSAGTNVQSASGGRRLGPTPSAGGAPAKASATNMPTVVLNRPELNRSEPAAPGPGAKAPAPSALASGTTAGVARVKSLARSAKAMAQRAAAKIPAQQSLFAKPVAVSSTAKTQDLSGKAKAVAQAAPVAAPSRSESISKNVQTVSKNASLGIDAARARIAQPSGAPVVSSQAWAATGKKASRSGASPAGWDSQMNAGG